MPWIKKLQGIPTFHDFTIRDPTISWFWKEQKTKNIFFLKSFATKFQIFTTYTYLHWPKPKADNIIPLRYHPPKFNMFTKFNIEFCITCQDTRRILGHSSIDCPHTICKTCSSKGHHAGICQSLKETTTTTSLKNGSKISNNRKRPPQDGLITNIRKPKVLVSFLNV